MEQTQTEVVPSEDGIQDDEIQEVESSTTETQDEEATSQQATEKETPFHEHPRWKEVQSQKAEAERIAAEARAQAEYYKGLAEGQRPQPQPEVPEGATPEEREFWSKVDSRAKRIAEEVRKQEAAKYEKQLEAVTNQYGQLAANQFLKDHPDVGRDSEELRAIVQKSSSYRIPLDEAYRIVMFDKAKESAVKQVKTKETVKKQEKLAAQVETKTLSPDSPISHRDSEFAAVFNKTLDESGERLN